MIQPASVDVIVSEALSLKKLDEVFHRSPKIPSDGQLLHSHHHVSVEHPHADLVFEKVQPRLTNSLISTLVF